MLSGCATQGEQSKWVKQTSTELSKQQTALNQCKAIAKEQTGEPPIQQQKPNCSKKYDSTCSFSRSKVSETNRNTQKEWQQNFDSIIKSCMDQKGYQKVSA